MQPTSAHAVRILALALFTLLPAAPVLADAPLDPPVPAGTPNPHPIADCRLDDKTWSLTCAVNGQPARLSFEKYREDLYGFDADFTVADVTGDGVDDLLVRLFIVGNTMSEMLSEGLVHEAKGGELVEALVIPADGFGRWKREYPNNLGICPGPDGTLAVEAGTKKDGEVVAQGFLLVRQNGTWTLKDRPKGLHLSCER